MSLHRVSSTTPIIIKREGTPGVDGINGKSGDQGRQGIVGEPGQVGRQGEPGVQGPVPEHQVRNGEIRFKNPDGTWGNWVSLGAPGGGGSDSHNAYTSVQQANFSIQRQSLTLGTNIFGVNFNGDVEIILPNGIDKRILIVIKDESNNAGTNNITVTTES